MAFKMPYSLEKNMKFISLQPLVTVVREKYPLQLSLMVAILFIKSMVTFKYQVLTINLAKKIMSHSAKKIPIILNFT